MDFFNLTYNIHFGSFKYEICFITLTTAVASQQIDLKMKMQLFGEWT